MLCSIRPFSEPCTCTSLPSSFVESCFDSSCKLRIVFFFFFSSRRRHTRSVSAFLLNRSSDLGIPAEPLFRSETQKEIAGIQSATSRQNTKDQVYAQNEMLAYQQKESTARVASIMENTNLSKQQQVSEIMRQMLTQAQTAGQYFTNDQI